MLWLLSHAEKEACPSIMLFILHYYVGDIILGLEFMTLVTLISGMN
jgi:hypothetical protein